MQGFQKLMNDMLVQVYHNIVRVEEEFLQNNDRINLTIREMHLIECVGMDKENGKTISEIADFLKVRRPSVTVAVKQARKEGLPSRGPAATRTGVSSTSRSPGKAGKWTCTTRATT